jgi:hypothetical protein
MRRLIAGIILIALHCVVILAQQKDQPPALPTPIPVGLLASDPQLDFASFQLSAPPSPFGQSQINDRIISPSGQSNKQEGPFVFQDGALYMRVPGGQFLMPVSGGGASGCFSLDLPQRITNLKEFIPRIDTLELSKPAPH